MRDMRCAAASFAPYHAPTDWLTPPPLSRGLYFPVFIGGYPVIVTATDISVTFDVQLLGTGVVYFVALPTSDPAPHTSEVVALTGSGGVDPIAAGGPVNVVAGLTTVRASTTVGRLQPMTHYNLFIVALDTQGNGQDAPRLLPFSTSQGAWRGRGLPCARARGREGRVLAGEPH